MKRMLSFALAGVFAVASLSISAMAYDYENEELRALWTQEFGDKTQIAASGTYTNMRALFDHVGNQDFGFDVDEMIDSKNGEELMKLLYPFVIWSDPMDPELLEYWKNYEGGVVKEMHHYGDYESEWASFVPCSAYEPENADKVYPVIWVNHGGNDKKYTVETYGFVQYAAKTQEFIVVEPQDRSPEAAEHILNELKAQYPIDMSRLYMTGDSMGGRASLENAAAHPERYAAIAPFGIGAGIQGTEAQKIIMGKYRMPIMYLYGTMDCYASMPPTGRTGAIGASVDNINAWFAINELTRDYLTEEDIQKAVESGESLVEHQSGIYFDKTYEVEYPDLTYSFGENYDKDGICMYTIVIADGGTHWHSPSYAEIVWDYFKHFSRNTETGELIYTE